MSGLNVYVASSWRNPHQPRVVQVLRRAGLRIYDFRNPRLGDDGFHWSEIDPDWKMWDPARFRDALGHPMAVAGFDSDMQALIDCDVCVLVQPCGRSAHLELGWAAGAGKVTAILLEDGEPELMYRMTDRLCVDLDELVEWLTNGVKKR